jgi:RNA polymerase sigma factor (sigma-70 family)
LSRPLADETVGLPPWAEKFSIATYHHRTVMLCQVVEPYPNRTLVAVRPSWRPPMDHPTSVGGLVTAARAGDAAAWDALVEEFLPLVRAVVSRVRLSEADAADVNQTVWLRLVEHLGAIREPGALAGWLATTARREALRAAAAAGRTLVVDPAATVLEGIDNDELDRVILEEERDTAMRAALAELPTDRRRLLELLVADPPASYDEISRTLGIPIGSVGPTRARALAQLRNTRAFREWSATAPADVDPEGGGRRGSR